ncbi:MAG: DUF421 domain-containing protein [Bacilli bacterium]|nr:DUF421 domain-containing protein [Bacilli bacterium]
MKELFSVLFRTIFFYFFVMFMFRIMGKREVGQLGVVDLIVSILIAELVAISIENTQDTLFMTVIPIVVLVILEILLARIALKSKKIRTFFGGKPSIIIDKGRVDFKEMVKQRYTIDDLLLELRQKSIKSIEDVEYALLEANGKLSIFEKKLFDKNCPLPLIVDGEIQSSTLRRINKSKVWLEYMLRKNEISKEDVFYCFYKGYKLFIIEKRDLINLGR